MDAKEAIIIIKSIRIDTKDYYDKHKGFYPKEQEENDLVGIDLAISALEKVETLEAENARLRERETPKEPIMKEGNNRDLFCSICGARVSDVADRIINSDNLQKYCGVCGQKLDWSSDKE